jgi:hypothetical protein
VLDSQLASKAFEATVRRASCERYLLDTDGRWVEVYARKNYGPYVAAEEASS